MSDKDNTVMWSKGKYTPPNPGSTLSKRDIDYAGGGTHSGKIYVHDDVDGSLTQDIVDFLNQREQAQRLATQRPQCDETSGVQIGTMGQKHYFSIDKTENDAKLRRWESGEDIPIVGFFQNDRYGGIGFSTTNNGWTRRNHGTEDLQCKYIFTSAKGAWIRSNCTYEELLERFIEDYAPIFQGVTVKYTMFPDPD